MNALYRLVDEFRNFDHSSLPFSNDVNRNMNCVVPEYVEISDDSDDGLKNGLSKLMEVSITEISQQDSDDAFSVVEVESQRTTNFIKRPGQKETTGTKFLRNLSEGDHNSNGINGISNKTLTEDAVIISALLPKYNYNRIFELLCKNRHAQNYKELTLWDLLPIKRPPVQRMNNANNFDSPRNTSTTNNDSLIEEESLHVNNKLDSPVQFQEEIIAGTKRKVIPTNKRAKGKNNDSLIEEESLHVNNKLDSPVQFQEEIIAGTKRKVIPINKRAKEKNEENGISSLNNENWNSELLQLYVQLTCRYPNVDKMWLNNLTKIYKYQNKNATFSEKLKNLISIVEKGKAAHLVKKDGTNLQSEDAAETDEKLKYLLGIFQNADPAYLKKVIARTQGNTKALEEFVQKQIENPTYITKEEKSKRKNIAQYTINFNVNKFLESFLDPAGFFENRNRKCAYNVEAFEFLKYQFKQFEETTIANVYAQNNYNLTLTACALQGKVPDKKTEHKSSWKKNASENIPLLQEIAYIEHKTQINEELEKLKEKEMKELDLLIRRNEFLECQCCFTECIPSKCLTCDDGHVFCHSCLQRGAEVKLGQGNTRIKCFDSECTSEFNLATLQKTLKPMLFSLLVRKRQEAEVMAAGLEGLVACPFCHFASIPPPEDKVFKCLNPDCMKESCRFCKEINHLPLKCYHEKSDKARLLLEEKMTEALVRKCSDCGRPYVKLDGCNKITCSCGTLMCYICGSRITGYDHFDRPGGCPLHSNTNIDAATVQVVARKVARYIKEDDPNVDIDLNSLLMHMPNAPADAAIAGRVDKVAKLK